MVYFKKMFHSDLEIRRFAIFQFILENENLNLLSSRIAHSTLLNLALLWLTLLRKILQLSGVSHVQRKKGWQRFADIAVQLQYRRTTDIGINTGISILSIIFILQDTYFDSYLD